MPIYVLPELKYNNIRDEFKDGKFGKRGFLLRIAVLDKSIRENTNSIKFDERETEIINYCFMMYRLLEPVNIDGICFFGINKRITYRYLKKIGVSNRFVLTKTDIVQQIKVRYLGNSGAINLDNGDKLGYHFFTKNLELDLTQCSVDFSIDLKESEVKNIIDRVYDKYKDQCIDFNSINESELNDEFIKELNGKMKNFRYGEIITVSIFKNTVVAINDFYPKVKIITGKEILHLIKNLIDKMENNNKSVKFDENVMVSGYEVINKIIRFSLTQPEKSISQFVDLPYLYIEYINNKLSKDEMVCEYNKIFKEMYQYIDIIKELYNKISEY